MRLIAAAIVAGIVLLVPQESAAQLPSDAVIVVLPLENPSGTSRLHWLREGMAALVADVLEGSGVNVVSREERILAYERLQFPVSASLSRASTIKVGQTVGATMVVAGRLDLEGENLVTTVRAIRLDDGRLLPEITDRRSFAELFAVPPAVARGLLGETADAAWTPPPSLAAFEQYAKGLTADSTAGQQALFEQALKTAPGFTAARMALWRLHTDEGNHEAALAAVSGAGPDVPLSVDGQFAMALSQIRLQRFDDAFSTLSMMQRDEPLPAVANALGVVQVRRGSSPQTGRATYYFHQASELSPVASDYFFNLGYAYWMDKDAAAAVYWLREAVRRDPADGDAHFVLATALQQTGAQPEAARERELARKLSARWERAQNDSVPRGLERLDDGLDRPASFVDTVVMSEGQRDQEDLARFHLDAGRRAYDKQEDREAERELRRALYLSPYLGEAHVLLARVCLRGGRVEEAVEALKIAIWSEETADAHVALAEAYLELKNPTLARSEVDRALVLEPRHATGLALRQRLTAPR
jgi:tetratricopeptide (TPR) repeat protein/TolB-like protein